jgi:hypothetical protein
MAEIPRLTIELIDFLDKIYPDHDSYFILKKMGDTKGQQEIIERAAQRKLINHLRESLEREN